MGTTSDKLTYLNETKTQLRTNINALGASLDSEDTFRSYANALDEIWEEQDHITGTGTSLSLATKSGKMKVNLLGNTSQTGTPTPSSPIPVNVVSGNNTIVSTGKNLLEPKLSTYTRYGITCTNNGDGSFTLNGTATQNADFRLDQSLPSGSDNLKNYNGTYTLSCNELTNGLDLRLMQDRTWTTLLAMINNNTPATATFSKDNCFIYVNVTNGVTVNNLTIRPMLEKGSTATTYEPYTSTSYPVNLPVKNLYEGSQDFSGTWANSSLWSNDDNTYNGLVVKKRKNAWNGLYKEFQVESGKTYTFSLYVKCDNTREVAFYITGGTANVTPYTSLIYLTNSWQRYSITFSVSTSGTIRPRVENTTADDNNYTYICGYQLEESSKMNSYTPYGTTPIELCKIGDYQDRFFKNIPNTTDYKSNLEDNEWYLEKKIGKVVLDGSEEWTVANTGTANWYYSHNPNVSTVKDQLQELSSHYPNVGIYNGNTLQGIMLDTSGKSIRIRYGTEDTTTNFKTWLASNNVSLYYILSSPTYTPITGTLKDELESAWRANSYNGTTNISQVNNDLSFNLSVTALGSE